MNLTKLFNFNYLKENLRKSKGILILVSLIVPLFTLLVIVMGYNTDGIRKIILSPFDISYINIFGMFVVPLIISASLFGYVFKKNSVDLVSSMPLKRSTIFITNTIGGIALITIIQAVTAILVWLCSILCTNIYIFPQIILDAFLMMWITYVFIFIVCNLAMSVSGTFLTQCAVTLLILFLIPFCVICFNRLYDSRDLVFTDNGREVMSYSNIDFNMTFTTPTNLIFNGSINNIFYSTKSICITTVLSIAYLIIGLESFKKRKMENAEESFKNDKVHLVIKALTMLPMIVFIHLIGNAAGMSLILYALIIVYYFAYDFIVKKKIAIKESIIALVIIIFFLQGVCSVSDLIYENIDIGKTRIDKKDIKEIGVDFGYDSIYRRTKSTTYANNKELVDAIFKIEDQKNEGYGSTGINILSVSVKDKTGKTHSFYMSLNKEDMNKILEIIDKDYLEKLKADYSSDGIIGINYAVIDDNESVKAINEEINSAINDMDAKKFYDFKKSNRKELRKTVYVNHQLFEIDFPIDLTDKTLKLVANYENKKTIECIKYLKSINIDNTYYSLYIDNPVIGIERNDFDLKDGYTFGYYNDEVLDFIYENKNAEIDISKEYYVIRGSNYIDYRVYDICFFTNDIEKINELIKKDLNKIDEENREYLLYDDIIETPKDIEV